MKNPSFAIAGKAPHKWAVYFDDTKLYAVKGIKSSISEIVCSKLPVMLNTVLLPFGGKIIYDSFIVSHAIEFGGAIVKTLDE